MTSDMEPVRVHLVSTEVQLTPKTDPNRDPIRSTFNTFAVPGGAVGNQFIQILGQAPSRKRAIVLVTSAVGTENVFLCGSQGDAQSLTGAVVKANAQPIELRGTDEVWVAATSAIVVSVGVIAEYC